VDELLLDGDYTKYVSDFKRPDSHAGGLIKQLPVVFGGRLQRYLEPRPVVNKSKCIGCRECQKCCPAQTIKIENNKATIIRENCIKCYCCQELCPKKAIYIKRSIFLKV
jgi:Pyruvate/2-oxoacid:ferredoxin oxidoreductase delta subunit